MPRHEEPASLGPIMARVLAQRNTPDTRQHERACPVCGAAYATGGDVCARPECALSHVATTQPWLAAERVGVPRRYQRAQLDDFDEVDESALLRLEQSMRAGTGVFLRGGTGIGKTHLAAALLIEVLPAHVRPNSRSGYDALWYRVPDLLLEIRSTFDKGSQVRERDVAQSIARAGVLVLDDLGAERVTDWSVTVLYSIIAARVDECRSTIVTSNLGLAELDGWEPRIASRLASFATVDLPTCDRRLVSARKSA